MFFAYPLVRGGGLTEVSSSSFLLHISTHPTYSRPAGCRKGLVVVVYGLLVARLGEFLLSGLHEATHI